MVGRALRSFVPSDGQVFEGHIVWEDVKLAVEGRYRSRKTYCGLKSSASHWATA